MIRDGAGRQQEADERVFEEEVVFAYGGGRDAGVIISIDNSSADIGMVEG